MHELVLQPSQTVADLKRTLEQQTGAPAHQQHLFFVPAEGADSDVHAQLPNAMAPAELEEHVNNGTLQLSTFLSDCNSLSEITEYYSSLGERTNDILRLVVRLGSPSVVMIVKKSTASKETDTSEGATEIVTGGGDTHELDLQTS